MKIHIEKISEEPTSASLVAPLEAVNSRIAGAPGMAAEFRLTTPLSVDLTHYRAGEDLYFQGVLSATVEATCARCLATFSPRLEAPFEFVLVPGDTPSEREELRAEDLALSFYTGTEIDLEPLMSEQAILALPTRALCREDCRGLCPVCGGDLNVRSCDCAQSEPDPRWSALKDWKSSRAH